MTPPASTSMSPMSLAFSLVGLGTASAAQSPAPPPAPVTLREPVTLRDAAKLGYSIQLGAIGGDEYEAIVTHDRVEVRGLGPTPQAAEAKALSLYAAYQRAKAVAGDTDAVAVEWGKVR